VDHDSSVKWTMFHCWCFQRRWRVHPLRSTTRWRCRKGGRTVCCQLCKFSSRIGLRMVWSDTWVPVAVRSMSLNLLAMAVRCHRTILTTYQSCRFVVDLGLPERGEFVAWKCCNNRPVTLWLTLSLCATFLYECPSWSQTRALPISSDVIFLRSIPSSILLPS